MPIKIIREEFEMNATVSVQVKLEDLMIQVLLFAFIVFVFLSATSQIVVPYINHDDWDFLAPAKWGMAYSTPWNKTLTEGRWLSYLWYQVSVCLTPKSSYLIFVTTYFFLCCAIARYVAKPRTFALCGLAIFFSPMLGHLSLWPTGMICSVVLCGLATWGIMRIDERYTPSVVFISTLLLVLAYPPLAGVILLVAAVKRSHEPIRGQIGLGVAYVLAFAAGTLLIYALNYAFHGYFGVKVAHWRTPRTPHSLTDLLANTTLYAQYWGELLHDYMPALVCGGLAAILLLWQQQTRRMAISILLATLLICGIELGIILVAGTAIPSRSAIWLWLAACLLCALVARHAAPLYRLTGLGLLLILAILGASSWWNLYHAEQPAAAYEARLASWIHQYEAMTGISEVTVVGDPRRVAELNAIDAQNALPAFQMSMRKRYGIKAEECSMEFCAAVRSYLQSHPSQASPLLVVDGKLALVFDKNGTGGYFERDYPTTTEESALKLGYPLYLSYGSDAVRLTPFPPGTNSTPLTIKLAPTSAGYSLHSEGNTCGFNIDYTVTAIDGTQIASGVYVPSTVATLPSWPAQTGIGIFSVKMGINAKNNYGCNIVVTRK